jgi:hypothetical protein
MFSSGSQEVCAGCQPQLLKTADKLIEELSRQAALLTHPPGGRRERRTERRFPYPRLIPLTPMVEEGQEASGPTRYVVGKHLGPRGLDFFHGDPLPERYAVVALPCGADRWAHLLLRITWCRFLRAGWYDSGGRFVRLVTWPDPAWQQVPLTEQNLSYALDNSLIPRCTS